RARLGRNRSQRRPGDGSAPCLPRQWRGRRGCRRPSAVNRQRPALAPRPLRRRRLRVAVHPASAAARAPCARRRRGRHLHRPHHRRARHPLGSRQRPPPAPPRRRLPALTPSAPPPAALGRGEAPHKVPVPLPGWILIIIASIDLASTRGRSAATPLLGRSSPAISPTLPASSSPNQEVPRYCFTCTSRSSKWSAFTNFGVKGTGSVCRSWSWVTGIRPRTQVVSSRNT